MFKLYLFTAILLLLSYILFYFKPFGLRQLKKYYPNYQHLGKKIFYNHKDLYKNIVNLHAKGRGFYTAHMFVYMFVSISYTALLNQIGFSFILVSHVEKYLGFASMLRAIFAIFESMTVLLVINGFPRKYIVSPTVAGLFNSLKHLCGIIYFIIFILGIATFLFV